MTVTSYGEISRLSLFFHMRIECHMGRLLFHSSQLFLSGLALAILPQTHSPFSESRCFEAGTHSLSQSPAFQIFAGGFPQLCPHTAPDALRTHDVRSTAAAAAAVSTPASSRSSPAHFSTSIHFIHSRAAFEQEFSS